jgi:hypothetical protein
MKQDICKICKRVLPNKDWKTKNGCIWCDNEYWDEKIKRSSNGKYQILISKNLKI